MINVCSFNVRKLGVSVSVINDLLSEHDIICLIEIVSSEKQISILKNICSSINDINLSVSEPLDYNRVRECIAWIYKTEKLDLIELKTKHLSINKKVRKFKRTPVKGSKHNRKISKTKRKNINIKKKKLSFFRRAFYFLSFRHPVRGASVAKFRVKAKIPITLKLTAVHTSPEYAKDHSIEIIRRHNKPCISHWWRKHFGISILSNIYFGDFNLQLYTNIIKVLDIFGNKYVNCSNLDSTMIKTNNLNDTVIIKAKKRHRIENYKVIRLKNTNQNYDHYPISFSIV